MILVAGMHRSGTSALTRALSLCGASLPSDLLEATPDNPDGFWESRPVVLLHDQLLASIGFTWDDIREFPAGWFESGTAVQYRDRLWEAVETDLKTRDHLLVKDPRLCRLVPLWLRISQDHDVGVTFVIPLRSPLDVAESLATRDQMPRAKALLLWLRHFLETERATRGAHRRFVAYEDLMRNGVATISTLARTLDLLASPEFSVEVADQIKGFLKDSRWHHRRMPDERTPEWIKRVHEWGLRATRGNEPDTAILDAIHDGLHAVEAIYQPLLEVRDARISKLDRQVTDQGTAIEALERARVDWEDERRTLHDEQRDLFTAREAMSQALLHAEWARQVIITSTCWRLTAPLRSLGALVRGRST
jgi:hypothetical protein